MNAARAPYKADVRRKDYAHKPQFTNPQELISNAKIVVNYLPM